MTISVTELVTLLKNQIIVNVYETGGGMLSLEIGNGTTLIIPLDNVSLNQRSADSSHLVSPFDLPTADPSKELTGGWPDEDANYEQPPK